MAKPPRVLALESTGPPTRVGGQAHDTSLSNEGEAWLASMDEGPEHCSRLTAPARWSEPARVGSLMRSIGQVR